MQVDVWNHSCVLVDKNRVVLWTNEVFKALAKKHIKPPSSVRAVTIVFKDAEEVQTLNQRFRSKDQPTDVLSFDSIEPAYLGEIILATQVIERQAVSNQHSFFQEAGYLILHGILHLLGYEHESGGPEAKEMMALQDAIYEEVSQHFQNPT